MSSLGLFASFFVAACTGPYCGPDTDFERPAEPLLGSAAAPALATSSDGTCYAAWESRHAGESGVFFRGRTPGITGAWSEAPVRLDSGDPGSSRSLEVRLAAGAGDRVCAVWQEGRSGVDDLHFRASEDGGDTWSPPTRPTSKAPGSSLSSMASLACGPNDALLVAWEDRRDGERDVYVARSLDFGHTWADAVRLDVDGPGATPSYHPQVVWLDDGSAVVVWWDECHGAADLFTRRSVDGAAWGEAIRLDDGPEGAASRDAAVSVAGSSIVVAWEEVDPLGAASIRARHSADGGASWGEIVDYGPGQDPVAAAHASESGVGWIFAQPGPGGRTSIAGRVMDVPGTTRFLATRIPAPGRPERVSELYGPTVQAMCASTDGLWFIGTGTASGKAVVEASRLDADRGWHSGAVFLFGGNGPLGYVPTVVHSVRAAASADGGLHLLWAADADGHGELGYRRLDRPAASSLHANGS